MADQKKIKKAFKRCERALKFFPFLGKRNGMVTVHSGEGLSCEVSDGNRDFYVDMPSQVGGDDSAPTPALYEAGALGSCVSITARMWAARLGVPIDSIRVEVEFDIDTRSMFDISDVSPYFQNLDYHITVSSSAPEADVMRVLNLAHNHSHVRSDFENALHINRTVSIKEPKASG